MESILLNPGLDIIGICIFKCLSDQEICKCRLVCKVWSEFIDSVKFYHKKILCHERRYPKQWLQSRKEWQYLVRRLEVKGDKQSVIKMGLLLREFNLNNKMDPICLQATPLHMASALGNTDDLRFLMRLLKFKHPKDKNGRTPLHYAAQSGKTVTAEVIITYLEDKNPMDNFGWTPLHYAASEGQFGIFSLIASHTDNKNSRSFRNGDTPLHLAVLEGNYDIVDYLVGEIGDKNPGNHAGWTPLHDAVHNGLVHMVKLLLPRIEDKNPIEVSM